LSEHGVNAPCSHSVRRAIGLLTGSTYNRLSNSVDIYNTDTSRTIIKFLGDKGVLNGNRRSEGD
jgi:hypothetical protein